MFTWLSWENPVSIWWVSLSLASVVNILFWIWTWYYSKKEGWHKSFKFPILRPQNVVWLSGVYVIVCAFRSFLPRADVQRITLFDTWFASVFVGRTVATFAELAFVAQWAVVLKFLAQNVDSKISMRISLTILYLIAIAELCSWYAVIRTHYIGNMIEESLWAVTYALIAVAIWDMIPKLKGALKLAARLCLVGCLFYVLFMVTVDVPMYTQRWLLDIQNEKPLLSFWQGLLDLNTRWVVTQDINEWKTEIPWQTLYFTFAVLVSIALCYVPLNRERLKKYI